MSRYVRVFHSAVDPADVLEVRRLFSEDVKPAFSGQPGCDSIQLLVSVDKNAGGLVEGSAVSTWSSLDAMEQAMTSRAVTEALVRIMQLLRQEPVTRIYEVTE